MTKSFTKQILSTLLSCLLVFATTPFDASGQAAPNGSLGYSGQGAPLSADELQQLLGPS